MNQYPEKSICDNAISLFSRISITEKYSKKNQRYYTFLNLHFKDHKYVKSVFVEDLEQILIDKLLADSRSGVDSKDDFLNDERGSL